MHKLEKRHVYVMPAGQHHQAIASEWQALLRVCKTSLMLLNGRLLQFTRDIRVTIGVLLAAAITVGFGLPYADIFAVVYVTLASAMACKVFRMVVLFERDMQIRTRDIEAMMMAVGEPTVMIR